MKKFDELPVEIQEKMLERQFQQTGKRNPEVFRKSIFASTEDRGFKWAKSPEGQKFWNEVIDCDNYEPFYKRYPKSSPQWNNCKLYPKEKVMMVSDFPITENYPGRERIVFMEKNGIYYAWSSVETIEEAKNAKGVTHWRYASEIKEEKKDEIVELSMDEIAKKFGKSVEEIRIKKE